MHVLPRMARQPGLPFADRVRAVVVHHPVKVECRRQVGIDLVEKSQKVLVPVPPVAGADRHSAGPIQGSKPQADSMPLVVVRWPRRQSGSQRQDGLRPIQRLYLALFLHAQNDRVGRRIHL